MNRVRFVMLGGFLGAGKTTAIARLARHYTDSGKRVGVVTNDQAFGLVDTMSLREQGFDVGEVTGACFCCKFNDLVETVQALAAENRPDLIIAEPVGSCTDLVATVIEPLAHLYADQVEVGPLAVLLKPEHGQKILADEAGVGFSPKAAYIFLKQLEEADVVVINKIDKLSAGQRQNLLELIQARYPDKAVLVTSARRGDGIELLAQALDQPAPKRMTTPVVDYDIYAAGEAELGWLNCTVAMSPAADLPPRDFSLDDLVVAFMQRLQTAFASVGAEPAHLKVLAAAGEDYAIANLVSSDSGVELSRASDVMIDRAELVVNARLALDPESLAHIVEESATATASAHGLLAAVTNLQSFRPGRPVPTHRMPLGHE